MKAECEGVSTSVREASHGKHHSSAYVSTQHKYTFRVQTHTEHTVFKITTI